MASLALQQRRQLQAEISPSDGAQLPFTESPQSLSWLPDAANKRQSRETRKSKRQRWKRLCLGISLLSLFLITLSLYYFVFQKTSSDVMKEGVQPAEFAAHLPHVPLTNGTDEARDAQPHIQPPGLDINDHNNNDNILNIISNNSDHQIIEDEHPMRRANKLHYGPVPGGPVLVRHTIINVPYLGASSEAKHGKLGFLANGTRLYKPGPRPPSGMNMAQELRSGGGFNLKLSDFLPLDRDTPDHRHNQCRSVSYDLTKLPEASVVIVFYNEPFSTLMRSVHSVLNRTPPSLLKEIILVDDSSDKKHIHTGIEGVKSQLEEYIETLPKVKMLRNPTRTGIVGARLLGIEAAQAEIFVILDSHIEVQPAWLEPLVKRIQEDRRRVVMPQVDGINARTFEYSGGGIGCTLGMIWDLMEHAFTPDQKNPSRVHSKMTDYVESPTMAGGLFAAHRDFFLDIGGYDRGMLYWGVENLELSFRLWQCGGVLECSRCSRVYHIFRDGGSGYSVPDPNSLIRNKLRTMAVWMDEYADLAWNVLGRPVLDVGNITDRLELRERLQCKPFNYFLNEVWPESDVKNLTSDVPFMGLLRNKGSSLCVSNPSSRPETKASLATCSLPTANMMYFRRSGRVMPVNNDEACLSQSGQFKWCRQYQMDDARWRVTEEGQIVLESNENKYLSHINNGIELPTSSKYCLAVDPKTRTLTTATCIVQKGLRGMDEKLPYQIWEWSTYRPPAVWTPPPPKTISD